MRLTPEQYACLRLLAIEHAPIPSHAFWQMMGYVGLFYHAMWPLHEAGLIHRSCTHTGTTYVITDTGRAALTA